MLLLSMLEERGHVAPARSTLDRHFFLSRLDFATTQRANRHPRLCIDGYRHPSLPSTSALRLSWVHKRSLEGSSYTDAPCLAVEPVFSRSPDAFVMFDFLRTADLVLESQLTL
jgi:hypothetical protein